MNGPFPDSKDLFIYVVDMNHGVAQGSQDTQIKMREILNGGKKEQFLNNLFLGNARKN